MNRIAVTLYCHSNSRHLQQIYTGFHMLQRRGVVRVRQKLYKTDYIDRAQALHLQNARHAHLRAVINDTIHVYYDLHDSYEIDLNALANVDLYFKRSYAADHIRGLPTNRKIVPLGLYYSVLDREADGYNLQRSLLARNTKACFRNILLAARVNKLAGRHLVYAPRIDELEQYPDYGAPARAIFMVKAWDPAETRAGTAEKVVEVEQTNEVRAQCIRLLRKHFGVNCLSGFAHNDYAMKYYRDCLLPEEHISRPQTYIQILKAFPIAIATTGLHGSIGAKLAEYVAHSKAIVSEQLNYQVGEYFADGQNYLSFTSAEECVAQVDCLFTDQARRNQLMTNNYRYYHSFLRPDSLVLQSLVTALAHQTVGHAV